MFHLPVVAESPVLHYYFCIISAINNKIKHCIRYTDINVIFTAVHNSYLRVLEKIWNVSCARRALHDGFLWSKCPSTSASFSDKTLTRKCLFQAWLAEIMSTRCRYWLCHYLLTEEATKLWSWKNSKLDINIIFLK